MIKQKVLLKNETTYRFGGACKNFFLLENKNDLHNFSEFDTFSKYFILGKGSNIAFSEKEFDGAVIQSRINYINYDKKTNNLELGSGTFLPEISRFLKSKNLSDGEFLLGIPGTVAGALSMNAGCYGHEFLDYVEAFEYFDLESKKIKKIKKSEINYGYRFTDINNSIILSVSMHFPEGDPEKISKKMKEFTNHRKNTQPSALYNAGSVFKNGKDYFFVSKNYFKKLIKKKEFIEHAKVFDNYYGSSKRLIIEKLKQGKNIVFDHNWLAQFSTRRTGQPDTSFRRS